MRFRRILLYVALALVMAPATHANGLTDPRVFAFFVFVGAAFVVGVIVIGVVAWVALGSSRPPENRWAACSLVLGLGSPLVCWFGPFAICTGIVAYRMGGNKCMAVAGIVMGAVSTLYAVTSFL